MKYRAVIFDLDGTLVDTLADIAGSANYAMGQLSLPVHSVESFKMRIGHGIRHMVSCCLPDGREELLDEAVKLQMGYYTENMCVHSRLYPGIKEMIERLKSQGYKLGVLSNKKESYTQGIVSHFFADGVFDHVAGGRDDIPLKPNPASVLGLAEKLGVSAEDVAYVGDSEVDMQTAKRAGMFAVGVTWGFRDRDELISSGAEALIAHASELLGSLGN